MTTLSYCVCNDRAVFLDTENDRYFGLSAPLNEAFLRSQAVMGNALMDPSPCLDPHDSAALPIMPKASRCLQAPPTQESEPEAGSSLLLHAAVGQLMAQNRLERWTFRRIIDHERSRRTNRQRGMQMRDISQVYGAFRILSSWFGEKDLCLVRSLAFRAVAFRVGFSPTLVIGVKLDPFAAHCWIQAGDRVENDRLERVTQFTPILAV